jgi:ABC-2 type transport system ATP-binding protein
MRHLCLTVIGLSKRFGDRVILDDVSFELFQGSRVALIGKNGAGKSTLLRLLVGLLPRDRGEITVSTRGGHADPKRLIGFLPEEPPVYEYLTGLEYLEYVGALWSLPRERMTRLAERYLHQFDLWSDRSMLIGSYSKGMKRKIATIGVLS